MTTKTIAMETSASPLTVNLLILKIMRLTFWLLTRCKIPGMKLYPSLFAAFRMETSCRTPLWTLSKMPSNSFLINQTGTKIDRIMTFPFTVFDIIDEKLMPLLLVSV